jgi:hypothetical protein
MPTLPSAALFDKDLSLRSPFPRHVSGVSQPPAPAPTQAVHERTALNARSDFSQIKRPTPVKARTSPTTSSAQQSQSIPHSLRKLFHLPVYTHFKIRLICRKLLQRPNGQRLMGSSTAYTTRAPCPKYSSLLPKSLTDRSLIKPTRRSQSVRGLRHTPPSSPQVLRPRSARRPFNPRIWLRQTLTTEIRTVYRTHLMKGKRPLN